MDIKERLAAMTSNLGPITVQELTRYGADASGRHGHGFSVECDGKTLVEVQIRPRESEQAKVDEFARVLFHLLSGSEQRLDDAEHRIAILRRACIEKDGEIGRLRRRLTDFEKGRAARGTYFAAADSSGMVWLHGRPSWSAFGLCFDSWHDLATTFPGLRPCGAQPGEGRDAGTTFVVMRPIADLAARQEDAPAE